MVGQVTAVTLELPRALTGLATPIGSLQLQASMQPFNRQANKATVSGMNIAMLVTHDNSYRLRSSS